MTTSTLFKSFNPSSASWYPNGWNDSIKFGNNLRFSYPDSELSDSTKTMKKNDVFVVLPGKNFSLSDLIEKIKVVSPSALLIDNKFERISKKEFGQNNLVFYKNLKNQIGFIASGFYKNPSEYLDIVAVTGTDGKTSVVNMLAAAVAKTSTKTAAIGSLGVIVYQENGQKKTLKIYSDIGLTTPSPVVIQNIFSFLKKRKVEKVFLEASSIGITEKRLLGTKIGSALFTSLGHDHLDYHGSIEQLAFAKAELFAHPNLRKIVFTKKKSSDLPELRIIHNVIKKSKAKKICVDSVGIGECEKAKNELGILLKELDSSKAGTKVCLFSKNLDPQEFIVNIFGPHNLQNLSLVAGYLLETIEFENLPDLLKTLKTPIGRFELFISKNFPVVCVDYAHTPGALDLTLKTLRKILDSPDGNLICVFGCGGNRDKAKRSYMGKIASEKSNWGIITADNPRYESLEEITSQIFVGISSDLKTNWTIITDRENAIATAIKKAKAQDIILVAGKGHESTQEINGSFINFSDREVVTRILSGSK